MKSPTGEHAHTLMRASAIARTRREHTKPDAHMHAIQTCAKVAVSEWRAVCDEDVRVGGYTPPHHRTLLTCVAVCTGRQEPQTGTQGTQDTHRRTHGTLEKATQRANPET